MALPRQFNKQQFARGNDTEPPPNGVSASTSRRNEFAAGHASKLQFYCLPRQVDMHFQKYYSQILFPLASEYLPWVPFPPRLWWFEASFGL